MAQYWDAFRKWDKDGSGQLGQSEVLRVLEHIGEEMTDEEFDDLFTKMDGNCDGQVDFEEFVATFQGGTRQRALAIDQEMSQLFSRQKAEDRRSVFLPPEEKLKLGVRLIDI